LGFGHLRQNNDVTLQQGSWLTVVVVCVIAVVLLAVGGYTGYSIVVGAVGIAAAINLT
jgi:hypothetical protein